MYARAQQSEGGRQPGQKAVARSFVDHRSVVCDRDLANRKSAVAGVDLAHSPTYGITDGFGSRGPSCYNPGATLNWQLIFVDA